MKIVKHKASKAVLVSVALAIVASLSACSAQAGLISNGSGGFVSEELSSTQPGLLYVDVTHSSCNAIIGPEGVLWDRNSTTTHGAQLLGDYFARGDKGTYLYKFNGVKSPAGCSLTFDVIQPSTTGASVGFSTTKSH